MSKRKILFVLAVLAALISLGFSHYQLSVLQKETQHTQSQYSSLEKRLDEVKTNQLRIEKEKATINAQVVELKEKVDSQQQLNKETQERIAQLEKNVERKKQDIRALETRKRQSKMQVMPSRGNDNVSKSFYVVATGYTAYCNGCSGITATGINLRANPNAKVIAVDPRVIPLGTKVWVEGYGYAIAGDTGGAIKGNKIDVHFATKSQAYAWGRRTVLVKILN